MKQWSNSSWQIQKKNKIKNTEKVSISNLNIQVTNNSKMHVLRFSTLINIYTCQIVNSSWSSLQRFDLKFLKHLVRRQKIVS